MIKMIVIDLDGTILNSDRKVSIKTKKNLKKLKDRGYIITIATGRIYSAALYATDGAEFANYIITDTGSCTYDVKDGSALFKNFISKETAFKFFKYYNENCRYIDFCDKNIIYKYSSEEENYNYIKTIKNKELILEKCRDISHISISMNSNDEITTVYNKLVKDVPELDVLIMQDSFSNRKWIETMKKGCSKYSAIHNLAHYLNIDNDEIIAFGDGLNDIEMLEKCGYGVALQNALEEVKEKADAVTIYDHNHDGVVRFLEEYLNEY